MRERMTEFLVGCFMLASLLALLILSLKVSGLTTYVGSQAYTLKANFDNIGGLKTRSPVTVAGVRIGEVTEIDLDSKTFKATVVMQIRSEKNKLPTDTSASIYTQGLVGSNYISLSPGFEEKTLKDGDMIQSTHPAVVLENLIGQFMYKAKDK